jgi:hypothetical protein
MTSVLHGERCPPTILKTFNLVEFEPVKIMYKELARDLNSSMHNKI